MAVSSSGSVKKAPNRGVANLLERLTQEVLLGTLQDDDVTIARLASSAKVSKDTASRRLEEKVKSGTLYPVRVKRPSDGRVVTAYRESPSA